MAPAGSSSRAGCRGYVAPCRRPCRGLRVKVAADTHQGRIEIGNEKIQWYCCLVAGGGGGGGVVALSRGGLSRTGPVCYKPLSRRDPPAPVTSPEKNSLPFGNPSRQPKFWEAPFQDAPPHSRAASAQPTPLPGTTVLHEKPRARKTF